MGRQLTPDQAPAAMRAFPAPSIGMRIFMASARPNPVGPANTDVLFDATTAKRIAGNLTSVGVAERPVSIDRATR
jgi:hypothetical protein